MVMIKSKNLKHVNSVEKVLGGVFSAVPITPNQWTAASLLFGAAGMGAVLLRGNFSAALALFFLAFIMDYADGVVARFTNRVTALGAYIDGVADRFVEAMIIISLMFYGIPDVFVDSDVLLAAFLFLGTMTSYTRAYADHKKLVTDKDRLTKMGGILERFERVSILLASMAASLFYGRQIISYAVAVLAILSFVTVCQRIHYSIKEALR